MAAYHKVEVALNKQSITVGAPSPQTVTVVVPRIGPKGDTGATGATGPANTLTIGTVTTGAEGDPAAATITGTAPNQTLDLTIPVGATGATGPQGPEGEPGTFEYWDVYDSLASLLADTPPQRSYSIISSSDEDNGKVWFWDGIEWIFAYGLLGPQGEQGPQGPAGEQTTDASLLTSGTLADARLSANVARRDAANTFSANQTLNGTNNVAPNQSAASGSSLMTRDLVRDESFFLVGSNFYPRTFLFGNSGAGSFASAGSGDIRLANMVSGTATSGFGRITISRGINNTPGYSGGGIRFGGFVIGAAVRFVYGLSNSSGALDNRIRFIIGGNGGTPATADSDPLGVVGFGWEIRSVVGGQEWRLFAHNGTSFTGGAWQTGYQGPQIGTPQYLSVVSNGAGGITGFFGVEGSRTLATTTIAGGPTTSGNSTNSFVDYVVVNSSTGTPVTVSAGLSEVQILCRPS